MTFYRKSSIDKILQGTLLIGDEHFDVYEDSGFVIRCWIQIGYARSLAGPYENM